MRKAIGPRRYPLCRIPSCGLRWEHSSAQATPSLEAQQNISAAATVDTQATEKVDSMIFHFR